MIAETVGLIIVILFLIWIYCKKKFSYWSSKGIRGPKPTVLFGNTLELFTGKRWLWIKDVSIVQYYY